MVKYPWANNHIDEGGFCFHCGIKLTAASSDSLCPPWPSIGREEPTNRAYEAGEVEDLKFIQSHLIGMSSFVKWQYFPASFLKDDKEARDKLDRLIQSRERKDREEKNEKP